MATTTKTRTRKSTKRTAPATETMTNDALRRLDDGTWPVGSVAHQGDLIFVRIASLPGGKPRTGRQLADGTTQGSRHLCEVGDVFDADPAAVVRAVKAACPRSELQSRYVGPLFRTVVGRALVTHPEHGDYEFVGEMVVAVVVQRNLDAEEREQRTAD